jgi:three-Cys-motif partner protein
MTTEFHCKPFDQETRLKLDIFRGYIREWLPVFLAAQTPYRRVNIYDFFSGPGHDCEGTADSPVIIKEEVELYLQDPTRPKATGVQVNLFFNDYSRANFEELVSEVDRWEKVPFYSIRVANMDFNEAFEVEFSRICADDSANLVILDQFGIKQITAEVFSRLIACKTTDILFFISSETIYRFAKEQSIHRYISVSEDEIKAAGHKDIHRFICNRYYRGLIPPNTKYYLAPFSIRKEDGNIYGLIFGTGNLLGLDKFLRVCWKMDTVTGEANYDIDNDAIRSGQLSLIPEDNVVKKRERFKRDVIDYIKAQPRTNRELYIFTLENGFLPKHMKDILHEISNQRKLHVTDVTTGAIAKFYYIGYNEYKTGQPRVCISYKE